MLFLECINLLLDSGNLCFIVLHVINNPQLDVRLHYSEGIFTLFNLGVDLVNLSVSILELLPDVVG